MTNNVKLFLLLFFAKNMLLAQVKIDSLQRILPSAEKSEDTTLVNIYQQLALYHVNQFQNTDSTDFYVEKGLQLALKLQYRKGVARGYMVKSAVYMQRNQLAEALQSSQKAYQMYSELGIDKEAGQALYSIGNVYQTIGDNEKALYNFIESTKLLEKNKDNPALAISYINLASGYSSLYKYSEAIDYSRKAIFITRKNKEIRREIIAVVNMVDYFEKSNQLDSALFHANDALAKSKISGFALGEIRAMTAKTAVLHKQQKYDEAIAAGNEILRLAQKNKLEEYLSNGFRKMAISADSLNNLPKALDFAKKALENVKKYPDPWDNQLSAEAQCHEILYDVYKKQGNFRLSLWHFEKAQQLKDSVANQEKTLRSTNLASLYEVEKKEQTLKELNHQNELQTLALRQKNTMFWATVASAALLLTLGFFFYRQKQFKAKQQATNLEQRLLRTRLDPHFWFNVLGSVQTMLLNGSDNSRKTAQYVTKIAAVMRQSLESSYQDLISIEAEIAFIDQYLSIQQIQTNLKFDYILDIDNQLDTSEILLPSMLLQPFVENAIQHGFSEIEQGGLITIAMKKNEANDLIISIKDNGKGIAKNQKTPHNGHRSRALEITKERLQLLAGKYKSKASISVANLNETTGAIVEIQLPLMTV